MRCKRRAQTAEPRGGPHLHRRAFDSASGNRTTVVWIPWVGVAAGMADLKPDDCLRFVCVETANAADPAAR